MYRRPFHAVLRSLSAIRNGWKRLPAEPNACSLACSLGAGLVEEIIKVGWPLLVLPESLVPCSRLRSDFSTVTDNTCL